MAYDSNSKYIEAYYRNRPVPSDGEWIDILHGRAKGLRKYIEIAEKKRRDFPNSPDQKHLDEAAEMAMKGLLDIAQEVQRITDKILSKSQ
jgi:hypothetical protein